jgi:glycosyltransferase involved in cell wall biosynthesis
LRVVINLEQLLAPSPGGVGRYAAKLSAHLQELGVEVAPVVARHSEEEVRAAWERYGLTSLALPRRLPLPRPLLYDSWNVLGWPAPVGRGQKADVVHAPSLAVPPKSGAALVVTVHDAGPWRHPEAFTARGRWFHRAGARAAARRADVLLTGTQAAADELSELAGLPASRCRVVPYGVDVPSRPPPAGEVRQVLSRYGLEAKRYVLWVGTIEPRKGVGTLVAAMAVLARQDPPGQRAALALAGPPGWLDHALVDDGDAAVLGPDLHRLGWLGDADLAALYAGAAVFAFPSRHEGFGLPVLEAMAAGVPVVASDIPALREVAGDDAVLVPPGDVEAWAAALDRLLTSPAGGHARVEAGRRRAARFSWRATAEATLGIYREVAG